MKAIIKDTHETFLGLMPVVSRRLFYAAAGGFILTNLLFIIGTNVPLLQMIAERLFLLRSQQAVLQGNVWQFLLYPLYNGGIDFWSIVNVVFAMLILYQFGSLVEGSMGSRRFTGFVLFTSVFSSLFFCIYGLSVGLGTFPLYGFWSIIAGILAAVYVLFPTLGLCFWGIPLKARMMMLIYGVLLALFTLSNISTMGLLAGVLPTLAVIVAIPIGVLLIKYPGLLNWFEGARMPFSKKKKANAGRMSMGHPGRHTDADDLYDDPHWKLDQ